MCLYSNTNVPSIAKRDILVYKVLLQKDGKYYAPYQETYEYKKGINIPSENKQRILCRDKDFQISFGILHSCKTRGQAKYILSILKLMSPYPIKQFIVVKMYIPKGTKFFISSDKREYASNKLLWLV